MILNLIQPIVTLQILDFETSSDSSFFHSQKVSLTESSLTITNGKKENNEQTKKEKGDNCDSSREIPILRLSNSNEGSNGEPEKNSHSAINGTSTMKQEGESCKESSEEYQSPNENEINNSIKVKRRFFP